MRLVSFKAADGPRIGVVVGDKVVDISAVDSSAPRDMQMAIAEGQLEAIKSIAAKADEDAHLAYDSLELMMPISRPGKILCLGLNYMEHVQEGPFDKQPYPTVFMRSVSSMCAANEPIIVPKVTETLDYEAELALVIGKSSRHLTPENALEAVAGYTCSNDGSVRLFQRHTIQWTMGKNFDKTGPIGPDFVTADELPAGAKGLKIECRMNGETVQSSTTDMMIFDVVETLVYLTQGMTLEPGDIILTGTPSGVGQARQPPLWMKDGDRVEVEIEGVGLLSNPVVAEKP